jgi:hypothetical protein
VKQELLTRNVAALNEDEDLPKTARPKPIALAEVELRKLLDEAKNPSSRRAACEHQLKRNSAGNVNPMPLLPNWLRTLVERFLRA